MIHTTRLVQFRGICAASVIFPFTGEEVISHISYFVETLANQYYVNLCSSPCIRTTIGNWIQV